MQWNMEEWMQKLKFDESGLIPAIVQDYVTHEVLTLAYMNKESLRITLEEEKPCFFSRSQKCLWRKGETRGDAQQLMAIASDDNGDALVVQVKKLDLAGYIGPERCFFNDLYENEETKPLSLEQLMDRIEEKKAQAWQAGGPGGLLEANRDRALKSAGESCADMLIAGAKQDKEGALQAIGELIYQILVLMAHMGISLEEVKGELARRY